MTQRFLVVLAALVLLLAWPGFAGELQDAAKAGDLEKVMRLLTEKPELLNQRDRGTTALHEAARAGQLEVVDCLIKSGADLNLADHLGSTPLKLALGFNHLKIADLLRQNGAQTTPGPRAPSATLTNRPAEPYRPAPVATPFIGPPAPWPPTPASRLAPPPATNRPAPPAAQASPQTPERMSPVLFPIHEAARVGEIEHLAALVKEWPDLLEATDEKGMMPLHLAAMAGRKEAVEFLLRHRANVMARSRTGMTPLHWAAAKGQTNVIPSLLAFRAEVDARDSVQQTPLLLAARGGHYEAVRWLLASHADPNAQDKAGNLPLLQSTALGDAPTTQELLRAGAKPDVLEPATGMSALHLAIGMRSRPIVAMLLTSGANPNLPDAHGATPLEYALRDGQDQLAALLRSRGAEQGTNRGWGPLEQSFVDHYRKLETVLLRGSTANKRLALLGTLPTLAEIERIFLKDSAKAWKAIGRIKNDIQDAKETDLAARGGGVEALRVQLQPPSMLTDFARRRGYLAADLPMGSLQLSYPGKTIVTEDYCFLNQRWVVLPSLDKVFPEWQESLGKKAIEK